MKVPRPNAFLSPRSPFTAFALALLLLPSGAGAVPPSSAADQAVAAEAGAVSFDEVWGYLLSGEERFLEAASPVTDVGYFGAGLNAYGALVGVPARSRISAWEGRVHLVIAEGSNQALTHLCLDPRFGIRDELVASIVLAAAPFDGIQIDFEAIPPADSANFIAFLTLLRSALDGSGKPLSVALPARTRRLSDPYEYGAIAAVADRIIVMAYDEHWSGGVPGPIASLEWCERVASYAGSVISPSKLVMGIPFYGRAWGDVNPAKAYKFSTLDTLISDKGVVEIQRTNGIPWFEYSETVKVKVYFEDSRSVADRARLYRDRGVTRVSFWRLGQEDPAIWNALTVTR